MSRQDDLLGAIAHLRGRSSGGDCWCEDADDGGVPPLPVLCPACSRAFAVLAGTAQVELDLLLRFLEVEILVHRREGG